MVCREQATVTPKVITKLSAQDRQGSRTSPRWPAVCMCRVVRTGVSIVVRSPQFQISSLLERDATYKQAERRWTGVDQIISLNVRLDIRI